MRILIVDDDDDIRVLLSRILQKWGHDVISASDGVEAWEILQKDHVNFVISDWMMPKMDGLELCERIRDANLSRYIYVILLTGKDEKNDLIKGLGAGADDFVVKPFNKGELNVRIRAGERILKLEQDLEEHNESLREANEKLKKAYGVISKDLDSAAKMQKSLLPDAALNLSGIKFDWIFCPSMFIAGDILNFFNLDSHHICFYLLDVAGHGIPAAMLSVTLSKILSPSPQMGRPLKHFIPETQHYEITPPAIALEELNRRFQNEKDAMQYFTMVYGIIDTRNGKVRITQAGHPSPIFLSRNTKGTLVGTGGFPVGMLPDVDYKEQTVDLSPGDRLFVYSDGVTECTNSKMEQFSEEQLIRLLEEWKYLPLREVLSRLEQRLNLWKDNGEFKDDVSLLAIEKV